ncbi:MAG: hypothetical protein ACR2RL_01960, partial [Gammaproteobacteria bacterium]
MVRLPGLFAMAPGKIIKLVTGRAGSGAGAGDPIGDFHRQPRPGHLDRGADCHSSGARKSMAGVGRLLRFQVRAPAAGG